MPDHTHDDEGHGHATHDGVPIIIDDKHYRAPKETMTGAELRRLAQPPIGADRDLFQVVPGPQT